MKLTIKQATDLNFADAFDRLGADPCIGIRDRFVLAQSLKDIRTALETYETERMKLVQQHGSPAEQVLEQKLLLATDDKQRARLNSLLAAVSPDAKMLDSSDPEAMASFHRADAELQSAEFEIALEQPIKLTEACKLSARDIAALSGLVTL